MKNLILFVLISIVFNNFINGQTAEVPAGDGSSGNPYEIANLNNLYWLSQNTSAWNKYIVQTADIDASSSSTWASGAGFTPIGNSSSYFTGSYDGQNHTINGLFINRSADRIGMFGDVRNSTVSISNLGLTNVNITGNNFVGGLAGLIFSNVSISNCYVTGTVNGNNYGGGLVGYMQSSCTINNSYASVTVNALNAGGLAGYSSDGTITKSFAEGTVNSTGANINSGGLIGYTISTNITNCYATASVAASGAGPAYVGGLIGCCYNSSNVRNSYSTGTVTATSGGTNYIGGFIGLRGTITHTYNFWDITTSALTNGLGNGNTSGITGQTTEQMTTGAHSYPNIYTNSTWDFYGEEINGTDNVWNINSTRNNGYPFFTWQYPSDAPLPVELILFTVSAIDKKILLNWQTAIETNNYGFEIERKSFDAEASSLGHLEEKHWSTIGFVKGHGNSNSLKEYSFIDEDLSDGRYYYRLKQIDIDGSFSYSKEVEVKVGSIPDKFVLEQNYPNPFNPVTTVKYSIPNIEFVSLRIYDVLGNEVDVLVNERKEPGSYIVDFDGSNLTSGVYFYRLSCRSFTEVKKMTLLK